MARLPDLTLHVDTTEVRRVLEKARNDYGVLRRRAFFLGLVAGVTLGYLLGLVA